MNEKEQRFALIKATSHRLAVNEKNTLCMVGNLECDVHFLPQKAFEGIHVLGDDNGIRKMQITASFLNFRVYTNCTYLDST